MRIDITGRGFEVTSTIHKAAEKHITRIVRHLPSAREAHVILMAERGRHNAEIVLHGKGKVFKVCEESADMYQALTLAAATLEKAVRKYVDRRIERRRNQRGVKLRMEEELAAMEAAAPRRGNGRREAAIRVQRHAPKSMTAEDAALLLEKSGDGFVVFRSAETGRFNVLYRRDGGRLALMDLED